MVILLLYAAVLLVPAAASLAAWLVLRRRGRPVALAAAATCLLLGGLLAPLPVHGGFTTPLFIALHELSRAPDAVKEIRDDATIQDRRRSREARFTAPLEHVELGPLVPPFRELRTSTGERAFIDGSSGLIWSLAEPWSQPEADPLVAARAFCARRAPEGRWALPSDAELALLWDHGGTALTGGPPFNAVSYSARDDVPFDVPMLRARSAAGPLLRCVARSAAAPAGGYVDADVPLELWNRFQLEKLR